MAQSLSIPAVVRPPQAAAAASVGLAGPSDRTLVLSLWPLLAASFVATLPLQVSLLFVAAIAADLGSSVAVIGRSRGLGGLAALLAGALAAPLIDRLPRARLVPAALATLATATVLGAAGLNLGTFAGVGLAGLGLGVAGYAGLAAGPACLGLLAFGTTAWAVRRPSA